MGDSCAVMLRYYSSRCLSSSTTPFVSNAKVPKNEWIETEGSSRDSKLFGVQFTQNTFHLNLYITFDEVHAVVCHSLELKHIRLSVSASARYLINQTAVWWTSKIEIFCYHDPSKTLTEWPAEN